jgi:hypothetical protein
MFFQEKPLVKTYDSKYCVVPTRDTKMELKLLSNKMAIFSFTV